YTTLFRSDRDRAPAVGGAREQEPADDGGEHEEPDEPGDPEELAAEEAQEARDVDDLGLLVGEDLGEPARAHEHREGRDEGHDFPVGDDDAVDEPRQTPDADRDDHHEQPGRFVRRVLDPRQRGDDAREAHDGTHREVDAARRDDEGGADRDDAEDRAEAHDRHEVLDVHEAFLGGDPADQDDEDEGDDEAQVAAGRSAQQAPDGVRPIRVGRGGLGGRGGDAHAAVPFMTRSSTPCSSIWSASIVVSSWPSAITSTRSDRPSTSSISLETTTIAVPASASRRMRA